MKLSWHWPLMRLLPAVRARVTHSHALHSPNSDDLAHETKATADVGATNAETTNAEATSVEATSFKAPRAAIQAPDTSLSNAETKKLNHQATTTPTRADNLAPASSLRRFLPPTTARTFPHSLPKPALRWVGEGGRVALREFDFARDADAICSWQQETYTLNFPDFRYTESFSSAFRHDLRRGALDPHHAIFVLDDGELRGFLWLVICENTWTGDRYGYVNNVYLTPSQRGRGLAREMMAHAERWFRSRGIKRARLTVTASNGVACKLYQSCGYDTTRWEMEKEL